MQWLCQLLERKEIWTIIGVILGFGLGELSRIIREWKRRRKLKRALFDEIETNNHLINQKKDNLRQIIEALDKKQVLRGESVHAATTIYDSYFPKIIDCLAPILRDNIHIIYGHLKVNDSFMDQYYSSITMDIQRGVLANPWASYKKQFTDICNSYILIQNLINDIIAQKPQDVFNRHNKK